MKYILIICSLLVIIAIIGKSQKENKKEYTLDVFTDTISDYVIVTTIANNGNNIGVSSIIVNDMSNN